MPPGDNRQSQYPVDPYLDRFYQDHMRETQRIVRKATKTDLPEEDRPKESNRVRSGPTSLLDK